MHTVGWRFNTVERSANTVQKMANAVVWTIHTLQKMTNTVVWTTHTVQKIANTVVWTIHTVVFLGIFLANLDRIEQPKRVKMFSKLIGEEGKPVKANSKPGLTYSPKRYKNTHPQIQ